MKQKMKRTISLVLTLAMVMSIMPINVLAEELERYYAKLDLPDASVTLNGREDGEVTIAFKATEAMNLYGIEGYIDLEEEENTGYFALSEMNSDALVFDPEEDELLASDGKIMWNATSFSNPAVLEAGTEIFTATYKVDKDTPEGTYKVNFCLVVLTPDDKEVYEDEPYYTATITVKKDTPKTELTADMLTATGTEKAYDGTDAVSNSFKVVAEQYPDAQITFTEAKYDGVNVGTHQINVKGLQVSGNYELAEGLTEKAVAGSITPYDITDKDNCLPDGFNDRQNIGLGDGSFTEPAFKVGELAVTGSTLYDGKSYEAMVAELRAYKEIPAAPVDVPYTFTANGNFTGFVTGTLHLTVVDIEFDPDDGAVTTKNNATYGDTWNDIVTVDGTKITATLNGKPVTGGSYSVKDGDKTPDAGDHQTYTIIYTDVNGKVYQVTTGTVNIAKMIVMPYNFSGLTKVYDGTPDVSSEFGITLANKRTWKELDLKEGVDFEITEAAYDSVNAVAPENYDDPSKWPWIDFKIELHNGNYTFESGSGKLTDTHSGCKVGFILPKDVTVSGIEATDRVYNGVDTVTLNGSSAVVVDAISGDDVIVDLTGAVGTVDKNVGNNKPVTVTGVTLTGTAAGNYNLTSINDVTVDITAKDVTVSGITADTREYNGENTVELTGGTVNGMIDGDDVTVDLSGATGTMEDANVGNNKAVTVTGVTLTDTDAGNYNLTGINDVTVDIKAKDVTDATVGAFDALTYTGSAQTPNASVTIDGLTATGTWSMVTDISDKTTFTANGNFTGTIDAINPGMKQAAATVTTAPTANTLTYSGGEQELVTAGKANGGTMVYSLTENGEYTEAIPTGKGADTYTVWYKVLGDANHTDSKAKSVEVMIDQKSISGATIAEIDDQIYTGNRITPKPEVKLGETVLVEGRDFKYDYENNINAGTATVKVDGMGNYTGTATDTFEIIRADLTLTVSIENWRVGYDANKPTVSGNLGGGTVTYEYKVKDADDNTYTRDVPTAIGEYTVKATVAETTNYNGGEATADFEITDKLIQTITAENVTVTYGDLNKAVSGTTTGNGAISYEVTEGTDVVEVNAETGALTIRKVGTATITVTAAETADYAKAEKDITVTVDPMKIVAPTADTTVFTYDGTAKTYTLAPHVGYEVSDNVKTDAGSYIVTVTLKDNYIWSDGSADAKPYDFVINKATVEVPDGTDYTYDTTAKTGVAQNDLYEITGVNTATDAGNYTVTVTLKDADNYEWASEFDGSITWSIAKMTVAVPTVKTGLTYKGTEQVGVVVPEGAVYSVDGTVKATNADDYTVTVTLPDADNYKWSVDSFNGEIAWSIAKANLAIVADDQEVQAGSKELPALTYTVYGLQGTDALGFEPEMAYETTPDLTKAGTVGITITGPEYLNGNYNKIEYVHATLTITYVNDSEPNYAVEIEQPENGTIKLSNRTAEAGEKVTVTVTPDKGYELVELIVLDRNGNEIKVTETRDGKFTFKMPAGKVEILPVFEKIGADEEVENPFGDVAEKDYYYDAVLWAVENGITNGMGEGVFAPNTVCDRAQVVTFLWRAAGCPEPKSNLTPFVDVAPDAYYYDAVLWAVENGITNGMSATEFAPNATVTRGQTVTFLWRAEKGEVAEGMNVFTDVEADAYYYSAVQWAVKNGITNGMSATEFAPMNGCTRGQIVTFLYRTFAE